MNPPLARRWRPAFAVAVVLAIAAATLGARAPSASAATPQVYRLPPSGTITVHGHGNGHGHGMSQYGARGAALAGRTAAQIVAFFYPGTTLVTLGASGIRVALSDTGTYPTVSSVTKVTGFTGALSAAVRYRLVPYSTGFRLQALSGTTWVAVSGAPLLPAQADFTTSTGFVRLYHPDGTSTAYRGSVGAVRSGAGQVTINRVPLDSYVRGVVPRESPSYWEPAALQAQAIAARSYARYEVEHHAGSASDICDTTACQVYGGFARYAADGSRLYGEEASTDSAVAVTANSVLRYAGATIFAQFSASDGGWTVDGGQPYLVAKQDPYDNAASGDPYLNWTRSVAVTSIASYFGLTTATDITVTSRDGNGDWGGRVLTGYVDGVDSNGVSQSIPASGFELQAAMGLPHNWFTIDPVVTTAQLKAYVDSLYVLILGRAADPGGETHWIGVLQNGGSTATVTRALAFSAEGRNRVVSTAYHDFLRRGASAYETDAWRSRLSAGLSVVGFEAQVLGSAEYYRLVGSTVKGFVDSLYRNPVILNREPDPAGEASWISRIVGGTSRGEVARLFLSAPETTGKRVDAAYLAVLNRLPTAGNRAAWQNTYASSGYDFLALEAALAATPAYTSRFGF